VRTRIATLGAVAALVLAACDGGPAGTAPERSERAPGPAPLGAEASALSRAQGPTSTEPIVIRFRSVEDPDFPPDPAVCAAAPFTANVPLGASLWAEATRSSDGRVINSSTRRIGTATACARITSAAFPPGLPQQFYARFEIPDGVITAVGACTLVSNDVPRPGLVLAGCHLRVIDAPPQFSGGVVTSLSVFNPARLPGFNTGSDWTIQLYGD
jgi:hypothetical protein